MREQQQSESDEIARLQAVIEVYETDNQGLTDLVSVLRKGMHEVREKLVEHEVQSNHLNRTVQDHQEVEESLRNMIDAKQQNDDRTKTELLALKEDVESLRAVHVQEVDSLKEKRAATAAALCQKADDLCEAQAEVESLCQSLLSMRESHEHLETRYDHLEMRHGDLSLKLDVESSRAKLEVAQLLEKFHLPKEPSQGSVGLNSDMNSELADLNELLNECEDELAEKCQNPSAYSKRVSSPYRVPFRSGVRPGGFYPRTADAQPQIIVTPAAEERADVHNIHATSIGNGSRIISPSVAGSGSDGGLSVRPRSTSGSLLWRTTTAVTPRASPGLNLPRRQSSKSPPASPPATKRALGRNSPGTPKWCNVSKTIQIARYTIDSMTINTTQSDLATAISQAGNDSVVGNEVKFTQMQRLLTDSNLQIRELTQEAEAAQEFRLEATSELSGMKALFEERNVEVHALRRALGSTCVDQVAYLERRYVNCRDELLDANTELRLLTSSPRVTGPSVSQRSRFAAARSERDKALSSSTLLSARSNAGGSHAIIID